MKKPIKSLTERLRIVENPKSRSGYYGIKGGLNVFYVSTNNNPCTNDGTSCSGTNNGKCTNKVGTDCSKATNVPPSGCGTS